MTEKLKSAILEQLSVYKSEASSETIAEFSALKEEELSDCHFGLGLYIRNTYLHPEGKLYNLFIANGFLVKDDMSSIMIQMWHENLKTISRA